MTVSFLHEKYKGIIGSIVELLAGEMKIDFVSSGQTTFQVERKAGGFEGEIHFTSQTLMNCASRKILTLR